MQSPSISSHIAPALVLLATAVAILPAAAGTATSTFTVSATVLAVCTVSASDVDFGNYDPSAASPTDATSTVGVICNDGQSYTVALDAGAATGATVADRAMTAGSDALSYGLYSSATHGTVWGDGTLSSALASGTGTGVEQYYTVYGRIAAGQFVPSGAYSDLVTVTVSY